MGDGMKNGMTLAISLWGGPRSPGSNDWLNTGANGPCQPGQSSPASGGSVTFSKDEEKYQVVENLIKQVEELKVKNTKIDNQSITDILTINGVRFSLEDGSWGLIRASSNKPSLVVVTESPTSDERKKKIFDFIDNLLQKTGKIGEYDQKI